VQLIYEKTRGRKSRDLKINFQFLTTELGLAKVSKIKVQWRFDYFHVFLCKNGFLGRKNNKKSSQMVQNYFF
jgi:hypothetical protein